MVNNALNVNDATVNGALADAHITTRGSNWYWTVTAIMAFSSLVFIGMGFMKPRTDRVFHYITASITLVAAISYFTMASNLGWTSIGIEFLRSNPKVSGLTRQIFYVRYIDWFITTPLLLLDLLLTAGLPWPTILFTILLDEIMIVTGLVGALVKSSYKWGFFAFGFAAFFGVVWNVGWTARLHARALGPDVSRVYTLVGVWTLSLWFLYPIAWGLCEGGNVISSDSEAVFYGVLDVLAKPVFGVLLLMGHRNIPAARLGLHIRDYDAVPGTATTTGTTTGAGLGHEKHHNGAGTAAGTTATTATAGHTEPGHTV
ncbi:MAG: ion channel activity [Thelocarpon impressellum]|nr:MAG: ion channel activity [Thelocarpon impressellum]